MERKGFIGGSDWVDVLAIEPYGCPLRVWYEKLGREPDFPRLETGPMRRGKVMEDLVAKEYTHVNKRKVRKVGKLRKTGLPKWWSGHPDRGIVSTRGAEPPCNRPGVLEIKTMNPYMFRLVQQAERYGDGPGVGILDGQKAQTHHYLGLTGRSWGELFIIEPTSFQNLTIRIDRDDELLEQMLQAGNDFWATLADSTLSPEKFDSKDRRCQRCEFQIGCQGEETWKGLGDQDDADLEFIDDDPELRQLVVDHEEFRELSAEAAVVFAAAKNRLKEHLEKPPRRVAISGFARVYYSVVRREYNDAYSGGARTKTCMSTPLRVYRREGRDE